MNECVNIIETAPVAATTLSIIEAHVQEGSVFWLNVID